MDSLANYGSDDECEETNSEKMGTSGPGGNRTRTHTPPEADVNYDEVQMDLSEESNNNNSAEEDPRPKKRHRSRSRDDPRSSKPESKSRREDRKEDRRKDDRHDRKHREERVERGERVERVERGERVERTERPGKSRRRRSPSKERRRSSSRERARRSGSKEKTRSGSKERRRSRSPRRDDRRRRSTSKDRASSSRYNNTKRFDRTSSKIAQLEKLGIEIKTPDSEFVTPQMLLQRSMDEQVQKVKNSTGIELPKYYNPAAMNPARYADQIQKRRLLWQKKETPAATATATQPVKPLTTGKVWEQTTFAQDSDGKVASKFKRLMGIKENPSTSTKDGSKDILKKQEEMFSSMEQQYEVARTATHTMRGVGLGFGTFNNYSR